MKLETLVVTVKKDGVQLFKNMNIQTDAVVANQGNENTCENYHEGNHKLKAVTSNTRGVGINRNIAFLASTAEIILFTDDDFTFFDGYENIIIGAFEQNKDADIIIFNRNLTKNGEIVEYGNNQDKRIRLYNAMKYGACSLAVRRDSLLKARVIFTHLFGGGSVYGSGEDSLFILDCLRRGLHIYTSSHCIGSCAIDCSSWFRGYNNKYFYDKGAWIAAAFPSFKYLLFFYFSIRYNKNTDIGMKKRLFLMNRGFNSYRVCCKYNEEAHE